MWLIVALAGFTIGAVVNILDKYVLAKTISKPVVFVFYSTIFALIFFLLTPLAGGLVGLFDYAVAVLAGVCFVAGLWALYIGTQTSEVSHIGPLSGAVIPIFTLILSKIIFTENFSSNQIIAITLLVLGSLSISMEKSAKNNGFHRGLAWGILSGFLWAIFAVASKYLYNTYDFFTGFVWSQGMVGAAAALLLLSPAVRHTFARSDKTSADKNGKKIALVVFDKFLGLVSLILVQYAVALGSVTLVYALAGVQYALLVIFVFLLSKFIPKFFKEDYARLELAQEFFAVLLIAVGLALLV
ncbi:MAG: EamA family transporter [Patescibacteria group bacterium]|nr:EamA family transporter [Patescibacteria group bacterium]